MDKTRCADKEAFSDEELNKLKSDLKGLLRELLDDLFIKQHEDTRKAISDRIGEAENSIGKQMPFDYATHRRIDTLAEQLSDKFEQRYEDVTKSFDDTIGAAQLSITDALPKDYATAKAQLELQDLMSSQGKGIAELDRKLPHLWLQIKHLLHEVKSATESTIGQTASSISSDLNARIDTVQVQVDGRISEVERSLKLLNFRVKAILLLTGLNLAALIGVLWLLAGH
ncbi:MAG: hypothetical protein KF778_13745 [Rhodocyclaceae bacterium]|nr:hypothetical protein [Rhodocyclaceae bacterium]MBX3669460.1 hypothetical protein [Rhodocyclaceae bacterium]